MSESENQQCLNAISMVRDALKNLGLTDDNKPITRAFTETYDYSLEMRSNNTYSNKKIKVFIQGSYANNTNVRTQSDVDIAIVQEEVFNPIYMTGITGSIYNHVDSPAPVKSFKDEVQECLQVKFGIDVERQNKSIKIHGNPYRKDTDTVPCMRRRDYRNDYRNDYIIEDNNYIDGIAITADNGERIINYPEQHISNGRKKNAETSLGRVATKLSVLFTADYFTILRRRFVAYSFQYASSPSPEMVENQARK